MSTNCRCRRVLQNDSAVSFAFKLHSSTSTTMRRFFASKPQPADTSCYDIVVDIRKISDCEEGWPVYVSPALHQKISNAKDEDEAVKQLHLDEHNTVIAVLGLFNRGKTFVVNKLAEATLPSSKKLHTRGLSLISCNGLHAIFLDTAGTNSPLEKYGAKNENTELVQKRTTEMFLQELSFALADILVVVVNELTWPDQEFLKVLQRKLKESDKQIKDLIVIHNYSDVEDEKDLVTMWKKYVISTQRGHAMTTDVQMLIDDETITRKVPFYKEESNGVPTIHYFVAKDDSPAGRRWNPLVFYAIRQSLSSRNVLQKAPFNDLLLTKISESLRIYCNNPKRANIVLDQRVPLEYGKDSSTYTPDMKGVYVAPEEWISEESIEDKPFPGVFKIVAEGDLNLKANSINFDGFRILLTRNDRDFVPKYDVIRAPNGLLVLVDLPGFGSYSSGRKWGGTVSFNIESSEDTRPRLTIAGERKLFLLNVENGEEKFYDADEVVKDSQSISASINNDNNSNNEEGPRKLPVFKNLPVELNRNRQCSKFAIAVDIPHDISDDSDKMKFKMENGILRMFLPVKATIPGPPIEL